METGVRKTVRFRIIQAGILLLLAPTAYSTGLIDRMHSIAEQAWEDEYIPDSGIPAIPLTDYDNFEVTELFRAVTTEDLEAAITDGYPMAWLEETLKDETIPWEDRYWLDRRVRAAIAQNSHTFFNPAGSPVHIDADAVFPGELYWREHMIVDPAGFNATEGEIRPAAFVGSDIGFLINSFGYKVGKIACSIPEIGLSRDAKVGVMGTDGNSIFTSNIQPYACFLYPDGSFREMHLGTTGEYNASISHDGSIAVFACEDRPHLSSDESNLDIGPIYVFDRNGNLQITILPSIHLDMMWIPAISPDGHFLCHTAVGANSLLIDCFGGESIILPKPLWDRYTFRYNFSPDGEYLCLGGGTTARVTNLSSDEETLYSETKPVDNESQAVTSICCSNNATCTALTTERGTRPNFYRELVVYIGEQKIYSNRIPPEGVAFPGQTEVSPNGNYLLVNPVDACYGYPSAHGYSDVYNLPLIVMQIEGR